MKNLSIVVMLVLTAAFSFAQAPSAALYKPNSEVYVGYIGTSPDYGAGLFSYQLNGGELAYTRNLYSHFALVASGAYSAGNAFSGKLFSATTGVKFNFLTGRVRPYTTGQVGFAHLSATGMYNRDHKPPVANSRNIVDDGLTVRAGVGVDFQVNPHVYWRVLQWDVQPMPWGRNTPYYFNFSTGVGYRF